MLGWILSLHVVSLITATKHFLFLGEGERYLEYAACPVIIMLVSNIMVLEPSMLDMLLAIALFGYCVPYYIAQVIVYIKWHQEYSGGQEYKEIIEFLKTIPQSVMLLIIRDQPWRTAYLTDHTVAFMPRDAKISEGENKLSKFFSLFPWPKANLGHYVKEHLVKIVLAEKDVVKSMLQEDVQYDFTGFEKIYENMQYEIYEYQKL
jgi:hypothetical protein